MIKVTIRYDAYLEETNDDTQRRFEMRVCKKEGPRYVNRDADIDIRIPHTGYVYQGYEFNLEGFGSLDVKPIMRPSKAAHEILSGFMKKGMMSVKPHILQAIYYLERDGKFPALMGLAKKKLTTRKDAEGVPIGRLQALTEAVVEMGAGDAEEAPTKKTTDLPEFGY